MNTSGPAINRFAQPRKPMHQIWAKKQAHGKWRVTEPENTNLVSTDMLLRRAALLTQMGYRMQVHGITQVNQISFTKE